MSVERHLPHDLRFHSGQSAYSVSWRERPCTQYDPFFGAGFRRPSYAATFSDMAQITDLRFI